jgi:hypothetical protein
LAAVVRLLADERELDDFARELDALFARDVEADFARVVDAFARLVELFARELEDFLAAALDLRVDPPLRLAGALRALGMVCVSSPAVGRRRDYLTRAVPATEASNTIHG